MRVVERLADKSYREDLDTDLRMAREDLYDHLMAQHVPAGAAAPPPSPQKSPRRVNRSSKVYAARLPPH